MGKLFEHLIKALGEAVAHSRGEIVLPHVSYETTWPDCPSECTNINSDGHCDFESTCWVRLDDSKACRVGVPNKYVKRGSTLKENDEYEKSLVACRCGGKVVMTGGTPGYPTIGIKCLRCGGQWSMDTYSLEEAAQKWGMRG